jgi:hypothetical protein
MASPASRSPHSRASGQADDRGDSGQGSATGCGQAGQEGAADEAIVDQQVYQASQTKRHRATRAEMAERWDALYAIVERQKPMTVRQVYYRATVQGVVEKTEDGYNKVQSDLANMRRAGRLPYGWLADSTRWQRKPNTFGGIREALEETAKFYRKALWRDASSYLEIWLEKDALAGVIEPVTSQYDVPLMVARGYASLSFLHSAAEQINELTVPAYIYHLGDYDPSGVNAGEKIEQTLRELAPDAQISFRRIAVTRRQISAWSLPTRPTKTTDTRSKGFGEISVELDAIEPDQLRDLVRRCIEQHLPAGQLRVLLGGGGKRAGYFEGLHQWRPQDPSAVAEWLSSARCRMGWLQRRGSGPVDRYNHGRGG